MDSRDERRVVSGLAGLAGLAAAGLLGTDARAETMGLNWYDAQTGIWKTDGPLDYRYSTGLNVAVAGTDIIAASNGGNPAAVLVKKLDGSTPVEYTVGSEPKITAGLTVASADFDGDGKPDMVAARASGSDSLLYQALSGGQGDLHFVPSNKPAYPDGFSGGVNVAVLPSDKNHGAQFLTAPASGTPGTTSVVQVLSTTMSAFTVKIDLIPGMDKYDGGIKTAVADVNGDGMPEVILSAFDPYLKLDRVAVYDRELTALQTQFTVDASGPTSLAAADVNGDGHADIVVGAAAGDAPKVRLYLNDGSNNFELSSTLFAYDAGYLGGVNVAAADLNGDGYADIVTAPASAVPEPGAVSVVAGTVVFGCARRRRKRG